MTAQDILDSIDDHGFSDLTVTQKLRAINMAYYDIFTRGAWPTFTVEALITGATSGILTFPTTPVFRVLAMKNASSDAGGFMREITLPVYYRAIAGKNLGSVAKDEGRYYYRQGNGTGSVQWMVWPKPITNNLNYAAIYVPEPSALVQATTESGILIPKQYHQTILDGALSRLYIMEDDTEEAQIFLNRFEQGIQSMKDTLLVKPADVPTSPNQEVASDSTGNPRPAR